MILFFAFFGLCIGHVVNLVIDKQLSSSGRSPIYQPSGLLGRVPLVGTVQSRTWIALAVEVLSAIMAVLLFSRDGINAQTLTLFAASLVLIDTGAIDFKIRMIDTMVLVVAMLVALLLAPVTQIGWLQSALGLVVAGMLFLFLFVLAKILFPGVKAPFGLGDVYLAAFIGAVVGFEDLAPALLYGIVMAGLVSLVLIVLRSIGWKVPTYIAYGTYLCLGALLFIGTSYP